MTLEKKDYFIGVSLPKKESIFISNLRKSLENKNELASPPHITLVPPFRIDNDFDLKNFLLKENPHIETFKMTFDTITFFKHPKYVTLVLLSKDNKKISYLHDFLVSLLNKRFTVFSVKNKKYIPHLTLANKVLYEDADRKLNFLKNLNLKIKLKIFYYTVYSKSNSAFWITDFQVPFVL